MKKPHWTEELTESEPITITLDDGVSVNGTLHFGKSRKGGFTVSAAGYSKTDKRTDYTSLEHMRGIARIILREMALEHRRDFKT